DLLGHHVLYKLHQKYGRYVRIGPNDLSVVDPDSMNVVLGPNSKCTKSAWYMQDMPYISMNTTRDRAAHDRRRRILSPAFSDKALRGYAVRIQKFHDLFIKRIDESTGQPMNVTKWFGLHGFDMMGDLVFNKSFNMLESGETHWAIKLPGEGMLLQGFAFPPWLYRVFATLPGMAGYRRFVAFAAGQLDDGIKQQGKTNHPDMMQPLIEHFEQLSPDAKRAALPMLQGDSRMFIVAGSDTTSTTLIHLFYRLCSETGLIQRLRDELTPLIANVNRISYQEVRHSRLLHSRINETLRMHYPDPSSFLPKGAIGDVYVPGDTVIQLHPYVMALDETVYERCRDFVPERWYSRPEMVKHKDAFLPFLAGSESCIGKNLAYIQLAVVTSQIILQFDVAFAPGEESRKLVDGSKNLFMKHSEELNLVFTRRIKTSVGSSDPLGARPGPFTGEGLE
ncbi:cytochrome P450, partial [Zopfia rhizophila CBS 207.26]